MAPVLRRLPLERAILIALPVTVLAVAFSSSWSTGVRSIGQPLRALGLVALLSLSLAYALQRPARLDRATSATAAALVLVAVLSATWSVDPRHSIGRAVAFGLVLVVAAALAVGTAGDGDAARKLLWALVAGAIAVALTGLLVAAVAPHDSVQQATNSVGQRYRGIGVNPNTVAMLFAVAIPLAAALWFDARGLRGRLVAGAAFLLFGGSIVASGSRGAAAAGVAGLLVLAVAYSRGTVPRTAAVAVAVAALALAVTAIFVTAVSAPLTEAEAARAKAYPVGSTERYTPNDAEYIVRLEDELGSSSSGSSRSVFDTSGRLEAWRGAVRQGAHRPLLGYGFATEEAAFVDRYRKFEGGVPENSFIGVFLQLGAVGLALFGGLLAALALAAARAGRAGAIGLAVLATGVVLGLVQSYAYAVGNVATLGFWLCAFLPAGRE
ncbi:MAG: hypothetical protein QOG06_2243 [Gaiellaceae bacterium]|nr:hypothetical protein [Gaiellaceae bacterium]